MKIMLVTALYPSDCNTTKQNVTFALHDFVRCWKDSNEVIVIKPQFVDIKSISKWFFFWSKKKIILTEIDGVSVINITVPSSNRGIYKPLIKFFQTVGLVVFYKYLFKNFFYPQIVVSHLLSSLTVAKTIRNYYQIPLILGFHNSDIDKEVSDRELCDVDGVVYRSYPIKSKIEIKHPELKAKKSYISNSGIPAHTVLSIEYFKMKKNNSIFKFITLSSLIPLKNIDIVLKSLSRLPKSFNWEYSIVGEGPLKVELINLTEKLGIAHRVKFYGFLPHSECMKLLEDNDIFILVSAPETFGLAYLEAMSKGLIVVGTKGWGIDGIIENGVNGYLCKEKDVEDLYNTISYILTHEQSSVLINSYQTILNYTLEKTAKDYLEFINTFCCNDRK